ncbi:MAG: hypothetical protein IPL75_08445 [Acidobacteria bacterium]|nr:hypothetical protein [Acidobacteriota bacterium]
MLYFVSLVLRLDRRRDTRVVDELIAVGRYESGRDRCDTDGLHCAQNRV